MKLDSERNKREKAHAVSTGYANVTALCRCELCVHVRCFPHYFHPDMPFAVGVRNTVDL